MSDEGASGAGRSLLGREEARVLTALIMGCGAALVVGGYLWRGVDFAAAVLLGFAVVALNYLWTKNLVSSIVSAAKAERPKPKALLTLSYIVKFALTAVVLFVALLRYGVDPVGILLGLSALLIASLLFAGYHQLRQG